MFAGSVMPTHWFGAFVSFCITTLTQLHMISSCPCPATYSKSNHASVLAFHNAMVKVQAWIINLASHREQTYSQLIKSMTWGTFLENTPRDSIDFLKKKFHAVTIFIEFSSGSRLWSISPLRVTKFHGKDTYFKQIETTQL